MNGSSWSNWAMGIFMKNKHKIGDCIFSIDDKGIIGPKLNKNSSKELVFDKIRQLWMAHMLKGWMECDENLPVFPKLEKEILKTPWSSVVYSYCFLKKPWKEAEKIIAKEKETSLFYAAHVLKSRFELGEEQISENPEYSWAYCVLVMKRKRLPNKMHQKMMLMAMKDPDNKSIKKYLSYKGVK